MPTKKNFNTTAIIKEVYPLIEKSLSKGLNKWKLCMSKFIQKRSQMLFDTMPCDRIYYNDADRDELFSALGINVNDVNKAIRDTYYWDINPFKPASAKDETTIVVLCIVRYFLLKKDQKNLDLAMIYQSFSGKYYPSIHYGAFPTVAPSKYRYIMEYVVNNKLSQKFDLRSKGSIIGSIKSINQTWITTYTKMMKDFDDEDITYVIQQLHNRIKSFVKNIAVLYYEAYENKEYVSYDKDNLPEEGDAGQFHLASNDSFKLQQAVENSMNFINTTQISYKYCKMAADANVHTEEIRGLFESILGNKKNGDIIRELITLLVATYMVDNPGKDITSILFYKYTSQPKPNTKDPNQLRAKEIVENLLEDNSVQYRKRKKRIATKLSYQKALLKYFAFVIINANK